jgi:hypothetical protein
MYAVRIFFFLFNIFFMPKKFILNLKNLLPRLINRFIQRAAMRIVFFIISKRCRVVEL